MTPDILGMRMAGPAIRALEIAKALHEVAEVRLVSTVGSTLPSNDFLIDFMDEMQLRKAVSDHEVLVFQGHILSSYPWIVETDIIIVADLYDPMHLEILEQAKDHPAGDRITHTLNTVEVLNRQIERADFMVCASEKQRDLWIGQLAALCRINPLTYDADPSLRNLIDVAPFGVQNTSPRQDRHAIKGAVPGISKEDKVIIWGGGIYNWFDPLTLIRAIALLAPKHPELRLFFLGVQHPNPNVPAMQMVAEAMKLSDELGLTNRNVFFNQEWVSYEDRANYLLDADLGVSTHFDHVETAFSFRTRILDYLWSGLPIVSTRGDFFAQVILEHNLGLTVEPEEVDSLAESIETALFDKEMRAIFTENVASFRESMTWANTLAPLVAFCRDPRHAADFGRQIISPRENHRRHLKKRIQELENSTTWKLGAPFRWLSRRFRRA